MFYKMRLIGSKGDKTLFLFLDRQPVTMVPQRQQNQTSLDFGPDFSVWRRK